MQYDTNAIRRAAAKLGSASADMQLIASRDILRALNRVTNHMEGDTAEALMEEMNDLKEDVNWYSTALGNIQRRLLEFAEAVEEADRRAASEIKAKGG